MNQSMFLSKWQWVIVAVFLSIVTPPAFSQLPPEALTQLQTKWNPSVAEEMPLTELDAPSGHKIYSEPSLNSQVLNRVDDAQKVTVKFRMIVGGTTYYISDWSWKRAADGKRPNWIVINQAPAGQAGGNQRWEAHYQSLRHDDTQWNCEKAFAQLEKSLKDPALTEFLVGKLAVERAIQPRSCVLALLCMSPHFKHDKEFAETLVTMLAKYQQSRWSGGFGDRMNAANAREWVFISYTGRGLNRIWVRFLVRNAPKYESILGRVAFDEKADFYLRWMSIHALANAKLIRKYHARCDAAFFRQVFVNLRDDKREWNTLWATRVILILWEVSAPHVKQRLAEARLDDQEEDVLKMLVASGGMPKGKALTDFMENYGDLDCDLFSEADNPSDKFVYELELFRR